MSALSIGGNEQGWLLRVTDLKQHEYCPRIVYYDYCLPDVRPATFKMAAGIDEQDRVSGLEERRSLSAFGLKEGVRHYNVKVVSPALGCSGQIDMVIETEEGGRRRMMPVDFKLSRHEPGRHFKLQLACYAIMLEEVYGAPVDEGAIYLIPVRRVVKVEMTKALRNAARRDLATIRRMIETQTMPAPTAQRARCVDCEMRRFCNDVL